MGSASWFCSTHLPWSNPLIGSKKAILVVLYCIIPVLTARILQIMRLIVFFIALKSKTLADKYSPKLTLNLLGTPPLSSVSCWQSTFVWVQSHLVSIGCLQQPLSAALRDKCEWLLGKRNPSLKLLGSLRPLAAVAVPRRSPCRSLLPWLASQTVPESDHFQRGKPTSPK